jgi:hypothetical protein
MCPANLKIIRPKIIDCLTMLTLAHVRAVRENEKYVVYATYD